MRKVLLVPFLISFHFASAGTGGAKDDYLLILSIIAVLLFILTVLCSIDFLRKLIKEHKEKKMALLAEKESGEESQLNDNPS